MPIIVTFTQNSTSVKFILRKCGGDMAEFHSTPITSTEETSINEDWSAYLKKPMDFTLLAVVMCQCFSPHLSMKTG